MEEREEGDIHLIIHLEDNRAIEVLAMEEDTVGKLRERTMEEYGEHLEGKAQDYDICWGKRPLEEDKRLSEIADEEHLEGSRLSYELCLIKRKAA